MSATNLLVIDGENQYTWRKKSELLLSDRLLSPNGHVVEISSIQLETRQMYAVEYSPYKYYVIQDDGILMLKMKNCPRKIWDDASNMYTIMYINDNKIHTKKWHISKTNGMQHMWGIVQKYHKEDRLQLKVEDFVSLPDCIRSDLRMYRHNGRLYASCPKVENIGVCTETHIETREPYVLSDTTVVR